MPLENRIGSGTVTEGHFSVEASFAAGFTQSAGTFLKILNSSSCEIQGQDRQKNDEATGSRDEGDKLTGRYQPVKVKIDHYFNLQPDGATPSMLDALIKAALGETTVRTTPSGKTVLTGSTASVIKVTVPADFQLFDGVVIENQPRQVGKIGADYITLLIPLSAVPATGAPISVCNVYHQSAVQPTFGYDLKKDFLVIKNKGCVATKFAVNPDANKSLQVTLEAEAAAQTITGTTELSAAVVNATGGSATWTFSNVSSFVVGSEFDVGTEIGVQVKSVDYVNNTALVLRPGSGRTTHSIGDACTPSWTSGAATGERAHGMNGVMVVKDATGAVVSIPATTRGVDFQTGCKLINDEDGSNSPSYKHDGPRSSAVTSKIHFRLNDTQFIRLAQNRGITSLVYYATAGARGIAIAIPRAEFTIPKLADGDMLGLDLSFDVVQAADTDGARVKNRMTSVFTW